MIAQKSVAKVKEAFPLKYRHGAAEEVFPCLRRIGHRKAQTYAPAWLRQIDLRYYDSTNRQSIFRYT